MRTSETDRSNNNTRQGLNTYKYAGTLLSSLCDIYKLPMVFPVGFMPDETLSASVSMAWFLSILVYQGCSRSFWVNCCLQNSCFSFHFMAAWRANRWVGSERLGGWGFCSCPYAAPAGREFGCPCVTRPATESLPSLAVCATPVETQCLACDFRKTLACWVWSISSQRPPG